MPALSMLHQAKQMQGFWVLRLASQYYLVNYRRALQVARAVVPERRVEHGPDLLWRACASDFLAFPAPLPVTHR